ncbi:HNH endonuclease signature motif containing protein [Actinomadura alba]|uniref:HNH endonuclease signature motif containing protein n=1 Tax=Actinomadura alba TaxID=406431 RepID=UPI001FEC79AC
MAAGRIDLPRAQVIADALRGVKRAVATKVEAALSGEAPELTTGKLRHRVKALIKAIDPKAFQERRRAARAERRLELFDNSTGTSDLALRNITTEDAHALKTDGDPRPIDHIRADITENLLRGTTLPDAIREVITGGTHNAGTPDEKDHEAAHVGGETPAHEPEHTGGGSTDREGAHAGGDTTEHQPAHHGEGHEPARTTGTTNREPAHHGEDRVLGHTGDRTTDREAAREGGVRADLVAAMDRQIARALAGLADEHLTTMLAQARLDGRLDGLALLTAQAAQAMAQGLKELRHTWCQSTGDNTREPASRDTADSDATGHDTEVHGHNGYRPPAAMRRLINQRHPRCVFPTCNARSSRCDLDHTRPYHKGGTTCRCNLAPLCRRHHKLKQHRRWRLFQLWPGLLIWITPTGTWHIITPNLRE